MRPIDDYNISPKIREIILKNKNDANNFTNVKAETIVNNALKGIISEERVYNEEELVLIKRIILELNPNHYYKEHLKNLSDFIKNKFPVEKTTDIVKKMVKRWYKPGMIVNLLYVHNDEITYFASLFETIIIKPCIILNVKFVGDMTSIFPDLKIEESTGKILDENIKDRFEQQLSELKNDFSDVYVKNIDNVYIIYSDDKTIIETISAKFNTEPDIVPEFFIED